MLLTVAIPTYNRADKLKKTLDCLICQINNNNRDAIEIIVSDNNSTDETKRICEEIINNYSLINFKYFKNHENIGFDANVAAAVLNANGVYSWILSDDDEILESSVDYVIAALEQFAGPDVNFAFLNYTILQDGKELKSGYTETTSMIIEGVELLSKIKIANTFISSNIFRTTSWRKSQFVKYYGSLWIHIFVTRDILKTGNALIIGKPQIKMNQASLHASRRERLDSAKYLDYYSAAHFNLCEFVKSLEIHGYPKRTSKKLMRHCTSGEFGHIVNMKLTNRKDEIMRSFVFAKLLINARMNSALMLTVKISLLFIPSFVFYWAKSVKKKFFG